MPKAQASEPCEADTDGSIAGGERNDKFSRASSHNAAGAERPADNSG